MTELPLLQYECPHCGGQFRIDASLRGGHAACPSCQGIVAISGQMPAATAEGDQGKDVNAEPITLACPVCQGVFRVGQDMAGQQVICPHCQNRVGVPGPAPTQALAGNRPQSPHGVEGGAAQAPLEPKVPDSRADASAMSQPAGPVTTDQLSVTMAGGDQTEAEGVGTVNEGAIPGFQIHETRRTIAHGDQVIELRHLTPEEKARQRLIKNIIMFAVCVGIMISYLLYHVGFWPFGR